ncbi:hypothetical protein OH77DRAFT_1399559, partial [Trametes cingulata]
WQAGTGSRRTQWNCKACNDSRFWFDLPHARRHEQTQKHRDAVARRLRKASQVASTSSAPPPELGVSRAAIVGPLAELLQEVTEHIDNAAEAPCAETPSDSPLDVSQGLDWDTMSAELGSNLTPSASQAALSGLTATLARWLVGGDSEDSDTDIAGDCEEDAEYGEQEFSM